jgi:voltage-gated potassium channel
MRNLPRLRLPDPADRNVLLERIDRLTELPGLALSFIMVPLLVAPTLWDLSAKDMTIITVLDVMIWAYFAVELTVKVAISPRKMAYLKSHWLDVLIVVVPFLRSVRLIRVVIFGARAIQGFRRLTQVNFLLVYSLGLILIAATVVFSVEQGHEGASITSFSDALWWSAVTISTVGYGDITPVTTAGRVVALVLMMGGIALFGTLTANLASFFVRAENGRKGDTDALVNEVQQLREEMARMRRGQE